MKAGLLFEAEALTTSSTALKGHTLLIGED